MSNSKKLSAKLSKSILRNISNTLNIEHRRKNRVIENPIILYMENDYSIEFIENMKKGYIEMGEINLEIAEFGLSEDAYELMKYESRL